MPGPTPSDIRWAEVESLLRALNIEVVEGEGSRVASCQVASVELFTDPSHPLSCEAAVRNIAIFLTDIGVEP